jgi:hypothetical protein
MDLTELDARLARYVEQLPAERRTELYRRLGAMEHVYPFSSFDYTLMYLMAEKVLSFDSYEDLRAIYVHANPYLGLFEQDPRVFGDTWCLGHLVALDPRFERPSATSDPEHQGQFSLNFAGHLVDVRAARAMDTSSPGRMVEKALRYGSDKAFFLNFGQLNLKTCDAFVFIGVWVDVLAYWLLSREEVESNKYLNHQHRGGVAYQIGIKNQNLDEFNPYLVPANELGDRLVQLLGEHSH